MLVIFWKKFRNSIRGLATHIDDFSQAYFPHMEKDRGILWNLNLQGCKGWK